MTSTMMESTLLDSAEWPSLGGPATTTTTATRTPLSSSITKKEQEPDDSDWENLQSLSPPVTQRARSVSVVSNVVVVDMTPKLLRHCSASSPDLRRLDQLHEIGEQEEEDEGAEASSFAMISGPGSVISLSSGFSFRDAILSPNAYVIDEEEPLSSSGNNIPPKSEPRKPRARPRFVVKPIRRCSKSTGDLQSLAEVDEDGLGDSDAMDFYHRKALGAKGRTNGLKIRPDELKRKQFTIQKKEMQRQAQR